MRPALGVSVELSVLTAALSASYVIPPGGFLIYVVVVQLLATYLVHCPAHYFFGRAVGIRFSEIGTGRTTLAKALPPSFGKLAGAIPVLTLSTHKASLVGKSRSRVSAMYASGTVASIASAMLIAGVASLASPVIELASWAVAIGYLIFDAIFSPRSGDLSRAKRAWRLLP